MVNSIHSFLKMFPNLYQNILDFFEKTYTRFF